MLLQLLPVVSFFFLGLLQPSFEVQGCSLFFFSTTMLGNGGASTSTAAEGRRRRRRSLNAYINKPCRYLSLAKVQQYVLTITLRHGLSVAQAVLTMSTNWTENVSLSGIAIYEQILTHFLNGLIRGRPKRGKGSCFYGVRQSEDTHDAAVSTHVGGGGGLKSSPPSMCSSELYCHFSVFFSAPHMLAVRQNNCFTYLPSSDPSCSSAASSGIWWYFCWLVLIAVLFILLMSFPSVEGRRMIAWNRFFFQGCNSLTSLNVKLTMLLRGSIT